MSKEPRADVRAKIAEVRLVRLRRKGKASGGATYVEVATAAGVAGFAGPMVKEQTDRLKELAGRVRELLVGQDPLRRELDSEALWEAVYPGKFRAYAKGRDPLTGEAIWGTKRSGRQTATGSVVMALSQIDNALWDLRGRLLKAPVRKLLSKASRDRVPAYLSLHSAKPDGARRMARGLYDKGFTRQKWFLSDGPSDGADGLRRNLELARVLREELGPQATLMFDGFRKARPEGDVGYAVSLAKGLLPCKPFWLEEPLGAEDIEGYARIKGETGIPLACGEHFYTRWNAKPFLDRKILSFLQCDPEWCGGVSEFLKICELARKHEGVRVVPHGHHVLAASHCAASQDEALCPMLEFGEAWVLGHQAAQKRVLRPKGGLFDVPDEPGLGPQIDWERFERVR
jgi:L-rhamnonate dehydratase